MWRRKQWLILFFLMIAGVSAWVAIRAQTPPLADRVLADFEGSGYGDWQALGVDVYAIGGSASLLSLTAWQLASVW